MLSYRVSSLSSASRPSRRAEAPAAVCGGGEVTSLGIGQSSVIGRHLEISLEIRFAVNLGFSVILLNMRKFHYNRICVHNNTDLTLIRGSTTEMVSSSRK